MRTQLVFDGIINTVPKANNFKKWTAFELEFLSQNYPTKGKMWCAEQLRRGEGAIRGAASKLGLKQDYSGNFFQEWQRRAARTKVVKKYPEQGRIRKRLYQDGKLKPTHHTQETRNLMSRLSKERIAKNGHPRGMLGKKHTPESCAKMSATRKITSKLITEDQWALRTQKSLLTRLARGTALPYRLNASWKSGWREIGGKRIYFRSSWEANYARYLEFLLQNKIIQRWEHEPETFWFFEIKRGCRSYLPDFRVTELDGTKKYHEVKGWMDERSKTKIKRMRIYYPEVVLRVIDSKTYRDLSRQVSGLIPGWEVGNRHAR